MPPSHDSEDALAMTTAQRIDGKACAAELRQDIAAQVARIQAKYGSVPGLAVIMVGDNPASDVYVRNKARQTKECGMVSLERRFPNTLAESDLIDEIRRLNADPTVHGILVQLPLPSHISTDRVIRTIDPQKDVDGFHPVNAGLLATGGDGLVPCTPLGCLLLLRKYVGEIAGLNAVIIGRSNIVGKPAAQLLLREGCTVTIAHSLTRNVPDLCRQADILVAAAGSPGLVRGDWIKPGSIVLDVGINRITTEDGTSRLAGDVVFHEAEQRARAITPVPGGVGPMTIACLLQNTLTAFTRITGLSVPSDRTT